MLRGKPIAVVGLGELGMEIAQTLALGGGPVILLDTDERVLRLALGRISRRLDKAARLGRLSPQAARRAKQAFTISTELNACASAGLVVEAIQDRLGLKQALLQALDDVTASQAVLATSSNTLSVTRLAANTRYPERVIGLHFPRPAHVLRLVEVVRTPLTRPDALEEATLLLQQCQRTPVVVDDTPGLIVNRVAHVYFSEALALLDGGGLDEATVDRLLEAAGLPMGPFRLMDFLGIDRVLAMSVSLYEGTFQQPRYRPHPRLQRLIEAGRTGRGAARGGFFAVPSQDGT
jgi:3-hydroxybutyryl-CoA dehydrogenase